MTAAVDWDLAEQRLQEMERGEVLIGGREFSPETLWALRQWKETHQRRERHKVVDINAYRRRLEW